MKLSSSSLLVALTVFLFFRSARAGSGELDMSLGTNGRVTTAIGAGDDSARAMGLQVYAKIAVAGWSSPGTHQMDLFVLRRA